MKPATGLRDAVMMAEADGTVDEDERTLEDISEHPGLAKTPLNNCLTGPSRATSG